MWKGVQSDLQMTDLYEPLECNQSYVVGDILERYSNW